MLAENTRICHNCLDTITGSGLLIDGKRYCCAGCVEGGPCVCSYTASAPAQERRAVEPKAAQSNSVTTAADAFLAQVEDSRRQASAASAPQELLNNLMGLLKQAATLVSALATKLEEEKLAAPVAVPAAEAAPSHTEVKIWDSVQLVAQNIASPEAANKYAQALGGLPSVNEIILLKQENSAAYYHVWTNNNARFTAGLMTIKEFRPLRVDSKLDQVVVAFHPAGGSKPQTLRSTAAATIAPAAEPAAPPASPAKPVMEVGVNAFFNARHAVTVDGKPGPVESKSWQAEVILQGGQFGGDGSLQGLDTAQATIKQMLAAYNNKLLNNIPPFDETNPTLENVARVVYAQIKEALAPLPLHIKGMKLWSSPTHYVWYAEPNSSVR